MKQNYRIQAEEIMLEAFWGFDEATKEKIFQDNVRVSRHFQTKTKKVRKQALRFLLENALPFLPDAMQFEVLRLELYDLLEIYRRKITQKTVFTVDEAFDLYSTYLSFLYDLEKYPSQWFGTAVDDIKYDWLEVVETIKLAVVTRLRASALHFKKDLQIIADNSERISAKIVYAVDFLGIKVHINHTNYSLERLYAFDDFAIPAVAGKFAVLLRAYIFQALNDTQYLLAIQDMQDGLLAQDFKVALEHYKGSNPVFNKVDFSFTLKGGAGTVSMNIKTWASLGKRMLAPVRKLFTVNRKTQRLNPIVGISIGAFFVGFSSFIVWAILNTNWLTYMAENAESFGGGFVVLLILAFVSLAIWSSNEFEVRMIDGEQVYVSKSDRTYVRHEVKIIRNSTYKYVLEGHKQTLEAHRESKNDLEKLYGEMWAYLQIKIQNELVRENYNTIADFLQLYQLGTHLIAEFGEENTVPTLLPYLFFKKLKKSLQHLLALVEFAHKHQIIPTFYITLFDVEKILTTPKDYQLSKFDWSARQLIARVNELIVYPILQEEEKFMYAFLEEKQQEMQADTFLEELAGLDEKFQHHFLIEGDEIVVRAGRG